MCTRAGSGHRLAPTAQQEMPPHCRQCRLSLAGLVPAVHLGKPSTPESPKSRGLVLREPLEQAAVGVEGASPAKAARISYFEYRPPHLASLWGVGGREACPSLSSWMEESHHLTHASRRLRLRPGGGGGCWCETSRGRREVVGKRDESGMKKNLLWFSRD